MKSNVLNHKLLCIVCLSLGFSTFINASEIISIDVLKGPTGYWTTNDSKVGQVGWRIFSGKFKKCYVALDTLVKEYIGLSRVEDNKVKYIFEGSDGEYSATFNPDNDSLTEDDGLHLKFIRADYDKIHELNVNGCSL